MSDDRPRGPLVREDYAQNVRDMGPIESLLKMEEKDIPSAAQLRQEGLTDNEAYWTAELAYNTITSRSQFVKGMLDPRRDINSECGFLETDQILMDDYRELWNREAIAARVVELMPAECWSLQPNVFENQDSDTPTEFEKAWNEVAKNLRGSGWYKSEESNPIWEYLKRADTLSGIGHYGVILLGINDGKDLSEPIEGINEQGKRVGKFKYEITYVRVFDQSLAEISDWEGKPNNPRFGLPTQYNITFNDLTEQIETGGGVDVTTKTVHWSRVVHIADNLGSSEVLGIPRMRPVFNNLMSIRKVLAGSGEMYWRGAFPGISFETHPALGGDVAIDETRLKKQIEDYQNKLQRYVALTGMTAKSLTPQVISPAEYLEAQIDAICIKLGVPKRVFIGSERGELASSQDAIAWNRRVMERRMRYVTPRVIIPFIDRLITLGILPEPKEYFVTWPELDFLSPQEKADITVKRMDAMTKWAAGGLEGVLPPMEMLTLEMGYTDEEATQILEAARAQLEDPGEKDTGSPLLRLVGGITGMTDLFQRAKDGVISEETLKQMLILFFGVDEKQADALIAESVAAAQDKAEQEAEADKQKPAMPPGFGGQPPQPPKSPTMEEMEQELEQEDDEEDF